ncbi:hypothetical protein A4H97_04785 [Niastella yeongjuensis]|uniref:DUF2490 domain-containing protein n=1 Tax=Niastella yeongjuensis TaxID=354355 RepID=A0A1V9ELB8_9BACT|nr:hypothetical protein [Niastella yeongjuensis]OQP46842.1 hypothetical protein A4H97_04785 [Niastella yeongjuensis]SEN56779.1 hypothetical protein SAMN05660816_00980 [Niastella yeongjuensis]
MKKYVFFLLGIIANKLLAQENQIDSASTAWKFSAWAEMFIIPGEEDFFNPTFYARHKNLHLEGRYNYEDRNTASFWAGRRFKFGEGVNFVFVPMAAVVIGNTNGMAPGLEMEIMYRKFDFYAESEYVFDFESKEDNFFYMYSELAIRPIKPIRTGLIAQRTKLIETDFEIQHGLFAEYYFGRCRAGVFYFNPFGSENFWIASFSVDF